MVHLWEEFATHFDYFVLLSLGQPTAECRFTFTNIARCQTWTMV